MKQKSTLKFYDAYNFQAGKDYYRITFYKKNCVRIQFGFLLDKTLTVDSADLIKELVWEAVGNFIEANGKKFHISFNHKFSVEKRIEDGLYMEIFNECTNATKEIMKQVEEKHQKFLKEKAEFESVSDHCNYTDAEEKKRKFKEEKERKAFESRKKAFLKRTKLNLRKVKILGKCAVEESVFKKIEVHNFPKADLRKFRNSKNVPNPVQSWYIEK